MEATMQTQTTSIAGKAADTLAETTAWTHKGMDSIIAGDGIMISIIGIIVVFTSLTLLSVLIRGIGKWVKSQQRRRVAVEDRENGSPPKNGISGEVVAAIGMALHEYLYELHDEEKTIITIQKVSKPYSPWSSKFYNMTRAPFQNKKRG
jgi:glutaconyl-CoA/methylmalonyl-CoA decarboxylase subunit delta